MATERTFDVILADLAKPFDPALVEFKPGAVAKSEARALALAYVDSREYMRRLDEADPTWSDTYEVLDGATVICRLTVADVTRTDLGRKDEADENSLTAAAAQAFKRACTKFGLGRYLYALPQVWAEFDPQRKRFTPAALDMLRASLAQPARPSGSPNGNGHHPEPPRGAGSAPTGEKPQAPASNGGPRTTSDAKPAIVRSGKWGAAVRELAQRCPYYATDKGQPHYVRMTAIAGGKGFTEVTDANLPTVLAALEQHAAQALVAA